jgi:hypothetical protein
MMKEALVCVCVCVLEEALGVCAFAALSRRSVASPVFTDIKCLYIGLGIDARLASHAVGTLIRKN